MATLGWRTGSTLKELLLAQFSRFDSFQLLRLLQWPPSGSPQAAPVRLRFRADLSAGFGGHEFSALRHAPAPAADGADVIDIDTPNYCIASLMGPLPEPFTEWVRDLKRAGSPAMADFLDIFNQRLNELRFQLKTRHTLGLNNQPPVQTEHAAQLAAIMGMGLPHLAVQIPLPQRSWLGLAGLLANCRRSQAALSQTLSVYIGSKVRVEPLIGAWHDIAPQERMALGRRGNVLGRSTLLGRRAWDQAARVRLVIEGLEYTRFCQLLPPGHAQAANPSERACHFGLVGLLRLLLNGLHDCEVELHVQSASIPAARLQAREQGRLRLGYSAWLGRGGGAPQAAQSSPPAMARYLIPAFATTEAP
ncbi:type VI secretion system baseplate subunit TssG [Herbaspirillum rubrisubalbicans]|uniref:Type VI secretion system baseplate subunit TssG n=1 Tax=Herbaspirillum rubrisubalbicans TaxID=80842 RepID=A0AAD0UCI9_9BURK|nr:type VI secretion system baseplate subunit TssG [Herbaspirillum rubrisubalbicans]ALU89497.1 hypothetical protein Hrubri_2312 [Herbaspirillum rubrisubalbicans M1]AYR26988.1 type VI secretion system baseplate subunit TssG [Herbaspirillum rubrisubalbicans]